MSDIAHNGSAGGAASPGSPFRAGAVALMLLLGIGGFVGMLVLGAYAPDLRSGRNGGAHALSDAATGYSALVELARATGRHPRIVRDHHQWETEDLLIVTPETGGVDMTEVISTRLARPTLVVLPKWDTRADQKHRGWVTWAGLLPLWEPVGVLAPATTFAMRRHPSGGAPLVSEGVPPGLAFRAPRALQVITGLAPPEAPEKKIVNLRIGPGGRAAQPAPGDDADNAAGQPATPAEQANAAAPQVDPHTGVADQLIRPGLNPLITDGEGGIVLAQVGEGPLFVLADPDLISNLGMRDVKQAGAVLRLLDWLNSNPPEAIAFDVSLNGFGHSRSPLKLLFEPPFLAMTLAIAAALLLAGIQAFARFGPVAARVRAIAFGKAALVDNSALLIRKAGREGGMGGRYAQLIRERAAAALGLPASIRGATLDAWLDKLPGRRRFTDLAAAAEAADDRAGLLAAARDLHDWQKEGRP